MERGKWRKIDSLAGKWKIALLDDTYDTILECSKSMGGS